jgi:hypothetical protein
MNPSLNAYKLLNPRKSLKLKVEELVIGILVITYLHSTPEFKHCKN